MEIMPKTYCVVEKATSFHTISHESIHLCIQMGNANKMCVQFIWEIDARMTCSLVFNPRVIFRYQDGIGFINGDFSMLLKRFSNVSERDCYSKAHVLLLVTSITWSKYLSVIITMDKHLVCKFWRDFVNF